MRTRSMNIPGQGNRTCKGLEAEIILRDIRKASETGRGKEGARRSVRVCDSTGKRCVGLV